MTTTKDTTQADEVVVLKQDGLGRVKTPAARREHLLDEFERSGLSGKKITALAGIKYQNFAGATGYTNQISNIVTYAYDAMNRKTNEVYVGVTTNNFVYNGAGDLLTLTDGKNQVTSFGIDLYGNMTNKVDAAGNIVLVGKFDANNRLTNRWSIVKGSTTLKYDAVNNLTNIVYPTSPAITMQYDALNRRTNMTDAVGTTVDVYDAVGELSSEDGPWANDTFNYTYANRLRTALSLSQPSGSAWTQSYGYEVNGVAGQVSLRPAPVAVFDDETRISGQNKIVSLARDDLETALLEQRQQRREAGSADLFARPASIFKRWAGHSLFSSGVG